MWGPSPGEWRFLVALVVGASLLVGAVIASVVWMIALAVSGPG